MLVGCRLAGSTERGGAGGGAGPGAGPGGGAGAGVGPAGLGPGAGPGRGPGRGRSPAWAVERGAGPGERGYRPLCPSPGLLPPLRPPSCASCSPACWPSGTAAGGVFSPGQVQVRLGSILGRCAPGTCGGHRSSASAGLRGLGAGKRVRGQLRARPCRGEGGGWAAPPSCAREPHLTFP